MQRLVDKYRPRRLQQVRGQSKAVKVLQRVAQRETGAVWIEGPSGTGKTTLALCLAKELGARSGDVHELDGDRCNTAAVRRFDDLARAYRRGFIPSPPTVLIVNEAHAMTRQAVQAWLTLLEPRNLPSGWFVIFTTTEDSGDLFGDFAGPFTSRCTSIRLTSQGLCATFAALCSRIATREAMNGRQLSWYENLAKKKRNNLRAMLQDVDDGKALAD